MGDAAFGLRLAGGPLPGLLDGVAGPLPEVAVELTGPAAIEREWEGAEPTTLLARPYPDGKPFLTVEWDAGAGYRVWADGHGTHLIAPDGSLCLSALPAAPPWRAMKLLASQTLPLLATLHGREVTHSAGVVVRGRLIGIAAASGTGKSSTAANLVARGARFFADDVLALDVAGAAVRAHPGIRLANLRRPDLEAIPPSGRARLGERLGESDKVHLQPQGFGEPLELGAMAFLARRPGARRTRIQPLGDGLPQRLLGNAFLPYLHGPARLERQLHVTAAVAGSVQLVAVDVGEEDDAAAVARHLEAWAEENLPDQR